MIAGPARVIDGDTLEIQGQRLRLEGIDAPELSQTCTALDGSPWTCGTAAAKALRGLIGDADAACDGSAHDAYGRLLVTCYVNGQSINSTLVKTGYAWAFVRYSTTYVDDEKTAKSSNLGIWRGVAIAPWEYRHQGWQHAAATAPEGCAIKGNISHSGRIYHLPWSQWYDKVDIDPSRGERWFCSESEALAAGWRPAFGY